MNSRAFLSRSGSDRASAYAMSNKLLRREGLLFAGWLDGPGYPGGPERIRLGVCDGGTGRLQQVIALGEGVDNHCGPALALDGTGRMHAIVGAHSGAFLYRWSDSPAEPEAWSPPEPLGPHDTYPSLVVDTQGTLHLLSRESGPHPRRLIHRRKCLGAGWEAPTAIALSPRPGYTHFMHSLTVGPDGRLHLTFQYHYAINSLHSGDAAGRCAAYLWSGDFGRSWHHEHGAPATLPLEMETTSGFLYAAAGGIRISNHVVDAQGRPWIFSSHPERPGGVLLRRDAAGWTEVAASECLSALDNRNGRESSLTRDADGVIHLVLATVPGAQPAAWYDPRHRLFHLACDEAGNPLAFGPLGAEGATAIHWLPNLEHWDWVRPSADPGPWLLSTRGTQAEGGATEVLLERLPRIERPHNTHRIDTLTVP